MSWSIEISDASHEDSRDIYSYIAFVLRSPENARNVLRRILAQIATLDEMPERFRPYPSSPITHPPSLFPPNPREGSRGGASREAGKKSFQLISGGVWRVARGRHCAETPINKGWNAGSRAGDG